MSILITGGAGFIGSNLINLLLKKNFKVICLDNFNDLYSPQIKQDNIKSYIDNSKFSLVKTDIRNKKNLDKIFNIFNIKKVVHLAALCGPRQSIKNPYPYIENNIIGTINVLESSVKFDIENFIFISSSSVYGITKKIPFTEEGEIKPISPYGVSKRTGELICQSYNYLHHLKVVCLRLFSVYGPRQRPDMAIHKFTRLINQNKEITIFGNGKTKRDYTHIDDIINAIISAINYKCEFEIFNLGSSKPIELNYLISQIEKSLGKKAKIKQISEQPGDPPITYADITKSKKKLNYKPKIEFEEGINNFVQWLKMKNQSPI